MELILILILIIFLVVFLVIGLKMLWVYQMPEDAWSWSSFIPKVIFVSVIAISGFVTILLPLDVREERATGTGLTYSWSTVFIIIVLVVTVVIPLAMMVYEASGDLAVSFGQKVPFMLLKLFLILAVCGTVVGIMYTFYNTATIPIRSYSCGVLNWDRTQRGPFDETRACITSSSTKLKLALRFDVYLIAVISFVGWFVFVAFGGVGMSALPLDLIIGFSDRPRKIDLAQYSRSKQEIGEQARELNNHGKELVEKERSLRSKSGWGPARQKAKLRTEFNKFKQAVYLLEIEYRKLEIALKNKGEHPLIAAAKLVAGFIFLILTLIWWAQIFVYVLLKNPNMPGQPMSLFLNTVLIDLDNGSGYIIAFFLFAVLCLYLLACVVKGAFKVGMRLFLIPMHPLKEGDTPISSLLFNSSIVILSTAAIAQFSYTAFKDYARRSTAQVVFAGQIQYLDFYSWFFKYNVFVFFLLVWSLLALVVLSLWPREVSDYVIDMFISF